jgi:hypothetical protein
MSRVQKHEQWLQELLSEYMNILEDHVKEDKEIQGWYKRAAVSNHDNFPVMGKRRVDRWKD